MAIAAASSFSVGSSQCHLCQVEGAYYSPLVGVNNGWIRHTFDGCKVTDSPGISVRCRNLFFGSTQFHWLSMGRDLSLSKVLVAADYSDSVPNPSSYESNQGYHPLEELKVSKRIQEIQLSSAEIARTTVEANSSALLVFPGTVHSEPHEQISWAEFPYVVDDYGDIFFEILDDENILKDRGASNLVNVLIGMDIPVRENNQAVGDFNYSDIGIDDEVPFDDEYFEVMDSEIYEAPVRWGMPDSADSSWVHPIYFAKCLMKSLISLKDFQDAEPDVLVHSTSAILERFSKKGIWCNVALKSLCKKKGLQIEEANLIGVDSLGIDVRIFSGVEVRTCRFPFKIRAMSEAAAEKKIRQLLFPRSRRKKFQSHGYELRDPGS
ncbi:hypothetical protein ES319_D05G349100v1 [Gossypium barbadense]|uniref:DUF2470 domain-containing protein n=1 Tax=Gossypium barbadense TaxID=3634 RepID=A0A5J5RL71_GOSBA|nr:hypothetical protein ES319_D05G349100v1 [Gossypium barbadense]